ncbi:serine protease snake [Drosophila sulfurigaster albostrigata]|uniref:serine protease snake n=1 Tax=Drosophila sulfurigaster albostrigata TaxID=89887 RepID=UPI002D21AF91|nr:serine protease snake [Drosophila sulfurigaster albostrigata]
MINAILLSYLLLLLGTQAKAAVANAAIKPLSQRGIIFPKESFDDCFTDDQQRVPGNCKLLEDCPAALRRWNEQSVLPKTCYFVKYDQFVCCDLHDNNSTTPTIQPEPEPEPQLRSSEQACEDSKIFGISIVGGRPAKYGEFPYMAALGWQANFDGSILYRCGGTLIAPTFVLTAAHCINFGGQLPATVRLGGENLTEGMGENHAIRRVFTHPDYTDTGAYNDIALLELDATQPSSRTIVCLWQSPELPMDELTAIGYGQIQFAGLSSKQLLKVSLQHVTQQQCQPHYQLEDLPLGLALSQMCAGDLRGVGDTCQGDSGGPLLMRSKNQWFVVGITSLGQGCASGPPSIYTRVSSYLDWIESIVWPKAEVGPQQPTFDLRMND